MGVSGAGVAPSPIRASSEVAGAVLTREAIAGADGAGLKAMRGAATAELLRCAELLRSVGAVDCGSNTTMLAYCGVGRLGLRDEPSLPPTCREEVERGACTVRALSWVVNGASAG